MILPKNDFKLVQDLLVLLGLDGDQFYEIKRNDLYGTEFESIFLGLKIKLFDLVREWLDIQSPPTKYFLERLSEIV